MSAPEEWVIVDTETTGLYQPMHVVEVAAQRMFGLCPVGAPFRVYLNHNVQIPADAEAVHGYNEEFLSKNGIAPLDAYKQLREYIGQREIASHFLAFDWDRTLVPEWANLHVETIGRKGMCIWALARRVIYETPSHRLDYLRQKYSLACCKPHSALGDIESSIDLLKKIIAPRLEALKITTYSQAKDFSQWKPVFKCHCLIKGESYEEELYRRALARQAERKLQIEREAFAREIERKLLSNVTDLISQYNLISESPDIQIDNRAFLFTGAMAWGNRSQAEKLIQRFGAKVSKAKSITKEVDYLVLGEHREKGWTSLIQGGKLTDAIRKKLLTEDSKFEFILESNFVAALNDRMTGSSIQVAEQNAMG